MSTKTVNINYNNLSECKKIIETSVEKLSELSDDIANLKTSINNDYYNVGVSDVNSKLASIQANLEEKVIREENDIYALVNQIEQDFSNIEKSSNNKVEISEEEYKGMLSKFKDNYNVTNPKNSMIKGSIGGALASMITATKAGINTATDPRFKTSTNNKNTSTDSTTSAINTNVDPRFKVPNNKETVKNPTNTSNGTTSKTTKSNSATTRTNSTVTSSGMIASSAVTTASTNAAATLSATSNTTSKKKKTVLNNEPEKKRKQEEKVPNDTKPHTPKDDSSNNIKKPTNNNPDNPKKPTDIPSQIKPDTPPTEQTPNPEPTTPTNTEIQIPTQENQSPAPPVTQNINKNSKHSFVTNTPKNNQSTPIESTNQSPVTESSTSLSDSVNNENTTNLFDTNVDDFSDIEESISSVGSNSKTGGSGVIPVVAGLGAAATVGIGAKVYKDRKSNNELDLNEDRPSNENKFWTTEDSMVIHSEKDEYDMNTDYPTTEEPASYTAVDNSLDEDQKDSWELPEINNDNQIIDLLGNE